MCAVLWLTANVDTRRLLGVPVKQEGKVNVSGSVTVCQTKTGLRQHKGQQPTDKEQGSGNQGAPGFETEDVRAAEADEGVQG